MESPKSTFPPDSQTYAIIGAAMEVHRELGPGFREQVYREALELEFTRVGIPYRCEISLPVFFKGQRLRTGFRADMICFGDIIVELKAVEATGEGERGQLVSYLKASGLERGLLLNFGTKSLHCQRMVHTRQSAKSLSSI